MAQSVLGKRSIADVQITSDSPSLWNTTLSPGWTDEDAEILNKAIMKFGVGKWAEIVKSGCLPGKSVSQLNLQTQKLLGQQSTAEFMGIHMNAKEHGQRNSKLQGIRKNGVLINEGQNKTTAQIREKRKNNRELYGLPEEVYSKIELPVPKSDDHDAVPLNLLERQLEDLIIRRDVYANAFDRTNLARTIPKELMELIDKDVLESYKKKD